MQALREALAKVVSEKSRANWGLDDVQVANGKERAERLRIYALELPVTIDRVAN
jgi:hypothetical protein